MLQLKDFTVSLAKDKKQLVNKITLEIAPGEIHLIMGPNGAGKSSLAKGIMGFTEFTTSGNLTIDKEDISKLQINERAMKGLYLAYQSPIEVTGVKILDFLRTAFNMRQKEEDKLDPWSFAEIFEAYAAKLGLPTDLHQRNLNEGFSGGERKKAEILQMLLLAPKYALLDEIDSGLDLDALKVIFAVIQGFIEENRTGALIISHNPNILEYLTPTHVHLMIDGEITQSNGPKLVKQIVEKGYANSK